MNAMDIEAKYRGCIQRVGSLLLLAWEDAVRLLDDCSKSDVRFLGIEAFRRFEDGLVQPGLEYSNIRFGKFEDQGGKRVLTEFQRVLRSPWNADSAFYEKSQSLIREGASNGYLWYEISLENPDTNELLFFRLISE